MQQHADSDNNIHPLSLAASKAVSGTVVTHHRDMSEECSAGGGVGMRHAGMKITDRACHAKLKACGSILVSLQSGAQQAFGRMCLCKMNGLALVDPTALWGFVLHCFGFPLSGSDSESARVSSAQLHPLRAARFPLEVTGVES